MNIMTIRTHLVAIVAAGALLLPAALLAQSDTSSQDTAGNTLAPADIRDAIESELTLDPGVLSAQVSVDVLAGIATLSGSVNNLLARDRATHIAETVKGVEGVVNQIQVMPLIDRGPAELQTDVQNALLADPATDSYEVQVSVDADGAVTLSGSVESWPERTLSATVAKGVAGVTSVQNDIVVDATRSRPDLEIQHDIEQSLHWSTLVDDGMIDVVVEDGAVQLTGIVGSAAEKRQARLRAWTSGVESVDVDGLAVQGWARDDDLRASKYVVRPDADIRDALERALMYDARVNSLRVDVSVDQGQVTLRGIVDNLKARRAAVADARNTVGVSSVRDRLRVVPMEVQADRDVQRALREAFARDPMIEHHDITATVRGGTAYLYGTVDNYFEKGVADDVAARVAGVSDVENALAVRSNKWIGYDPFLPDPFIYGFDWYDYSPPHTWQRDDEIEDDIESELWWSPFVDADDVTVTVEDGVATLTGTVDSWSEYRAAAENAYEGGAMWVDNDLIVERNR